MEQEPNNRRTVVLVILDGWGMGPADKSNPVHVAAPQNLARIMEQYPTTSLQASGINVGLPWGETGNSEVGHLTIGAGRVIYQHFPRITLAIQDGSFFENETLKKCFSHAREHNGTFHAAGLLTKTPTHAFIDHLLAIIEMAKKEGVEKINLHLFGDGKDSPPGTISELIKQLNKNTIATIMGRYYAMDREANWSLTQTAYETLTQPGEATTETIEQVVEKNFTQNKSEELIPPTRLKKDGNVKDGDAIFFFNFREDSIRQLAESFIDPSFSSFPVNQYKNLMVASMTRYKETFPTPVAFPPEIVNRPLGQVISQEGKTQFRVAETYKYAHVTYFFNALRETPYENEYRVLIPSLQVPHPAEHPELCAKIITDRLIQSIENQAFDFILVNYANGDTIGHTADFNAAVETVKVVDVEIGRILKSIEGTPTILCITSDHGNIEHVFNSVTGRPDTSHDPNPVPFILVAKELAGRKFTVCQNLEVDTGGSLADVAPTILDMMHIQKPPEMTGTSLLESLI